MVSAMQVKTRPRHVLEDALPAGEGGPAAWGRREHSWGFVV